MAKTTYQMLGILSLTDRERALPPSTEINELTFAVKKSTMMLSGMSVFFFFPTALLGTPLLIYDINLSYNTQKKKKKKKKKKQKPKRGRCNGTNVPCEAPLLKARE